MIHPTAPTILSHKADPNPHVRTQLEFQGRQPNQGCRIYYFDSCWTQSDVPVYLQVLTVKEVCGKHTTRRWWSQ